MRGNSCSAVLLVLLLCVGTAHAQLKVNELGEEGNVTSLVKNILAGAGVDIVKVRYSGHNEAIGTFTDEQGATGFGKGLVMATGRVELIAGKNARENTSTNFGDAFFSDKHIRTKASLCDGAVLEIDFVPKKDSIALSLVFGSDEYPEFVGKEFNDVFKVVLQPLFGKAPAQNIARIAKKNIGINTVNRDSNSSLYIDNTAPANPFYEYIEFDGFTRPLYIGSRVVKGKPYRLRILLVDLEDCEYDTGILLDAYSFRSVSSKPKKFRAVTKKYHFAARGSSISNAVKQQCGLLLDSLQRYTYDSLYLTLTFAADVNDSLRNSFMQHFSTAAVRAGKIVLMKQTADGLMSPSMISMVVTAYRKPE